MFITMPSMRNYLRPRLLFSTMLDQFERAIVKLGNLQPGGNLKKFRVGGWRVESDPQSAFHSLVWSANTYAKPWRGCLLTVYLSKSKGNAIKSIEVHNSRCPAKDFHTICDMFVQEMRKRNRRVTYRGIY